MYFQKAKYLPKLISGQSIGAICVADEACGSDAEMTLTRAERINEEEIFLLSGRHSILDVPDSLNPDSFELWKLGSVRYSIC